MANAGPALPSHSTEPKNALAVAGAIVGAAGLALALVGLAGLVAAFAGMGGAFDQFAWTVLGAALGLVALVLGVVAARRPGRSGAKRLAIGAGVVAMIAPALYLVVVVGALFVTGFS